MLPLFLVFIEVGIERLSDSCIFSFRFVNRSLQKLFGKEISYHRTFRVNDHTTEKLPDKSKLWSQSR
jgi:hypothetical protein